MSGYILCQVNRTETPYYIEKIGVNVYSIEELCYYLYHNIYLLDETILNEGLCDWLRNQLGFRRLSQRLYPMVGTGVGAGAFILPVFKEVNYLTSEEQKELNQDLLKMDQSPEAVRLKRSGDTLAGHGKYVSAIHMYQQTLTKLKNTNLGDQFVGGVCNNMGSAYMGMFQISEMLECMRLANENLHTRESLKRYLYALYLNLPKNEYEGKLLELSVEPAMQDEVAQEIEDARQNHFDNPVGIRYLDIQEAEKSGDTLRYARSLDQLLEDLTKSYHQNTGL